MRNFQKQLLLLLILVFIAIGGCVKKTEDQPPSSRDGVSDGSGDRADTPSDEALPPDRPPAAPKGEVGRNEYTIQVGIFDRPEAADQLAYELRAKNVNNFTQKVGRRWRVCVGHYYSPDRADRRLRQLLDMGFDKAIVIAPER